jgi:hypothetical protein
MGQVIFGNCSPVTFKNGNPPQTSPKFDFQGGIRRGPTRVGVQINQNKQMAYRHIPCAIHASAAQGFLTSK